MAYLVGNLSSDQQSAYDADKPVFVATNAIESATSVVWASNSSFPATPVEYTLVPPLSQRGLIGRGANLDGSENGYPIHRAYDRHAGPITRQAGPNLSTYRMLIQLPTSAPSFDCVWMRHNDLVEHVTPPVITVTVEIASDAAFTADVVTIASWSAGSGTLSNRMWQGNLNSAFERYTNVEYVRITWDASGTVFQRPEVCEIFLGSQHQISRRPQEPWDNIALEMPAGDTVSKGGVRTRYAFGYALTEQDFSFRFGTYASYKLTDTLSITAIFTNSQVAQLPVLYIDNPKGVNHNLTRTYLGVIDETFLSQPLDGPLERTFDMTFVESAPGQAQDLGQTGGYVG